ncbi:MULTISPECIES: heterocyst frequency control protein PatD [Pseudanabaena]|uniref:Uncharacterized protein n=2 Tax=Pseudanabaena TaxID=1152 RepID=L8N1V0_9CYAN|nr:MULTISPECIES: heterocyst frequency control protein PatD [Pseudanabaena]ELS32710.1 hypothetical protein Pse7429DRAFT_2197 [Pseudanabaena biceps PCC 7429]MDG3495066.1 heterocyst frequency control protein PatD [Pseudanabaena catenata USMAC16]
MSQNYLDLTHQLRSQLEILQTAIASQLEPSPTKVKEWMRSYGEIQSFFQTQIINTALEISPQNLSLQVEIDKQLKMLGADLNLLQTARNPITWQKRHQQAGDRFVLLKRYCEMSSE